MRILVFVPSWNTGTVWHWLCCKIGLHRIWMPFVTNRWTCRDCGRMWAAIDRWGNPRREVYTTLPMPRIEPADSTSVAEGEKAN